MTLLQKDRPAGLSRLAPQPAASAKRSTEPSRFRDRVMACWLGKAVGGTLGMPFEGVPTVLDLTYYDPIPQEMLPNDDLDLQVLWAAVLQGQLNRGETLRVDRDVIADAFLENVDFPFDEYGVAIRNLKLGLRPPLSGSFDNWFSNGMGAAIRSEIWACLAAGDPELAALYAKEDAVLDHAGDGVDAEVFLAALQADAFNHTTADDPRPMIRAALQHITQDGRTARAIQDTITWWDESGDWQQVRSLVIKHHGSDNMTDTTQNLCFTMLGWLEGNGDFGRTICTAVNCGCDTDCTGATAGALLGILDPDCIGEKWLKPIGRQLVVTPEVKPPTGVKYPETLDDFTDQVLMLREKLGGRRPSPAAEPTTDTKPFGLEAEIAFEDWRTRPGYREHFGLPGAPGMPTPCPTLPASAKSVRFTGTSGSLASDAFEAPTLLMRMRFHISADETGRQQFMFNSPQPHRVWLDGELLLGREEGRMAPSFHRTPLNQWAMVDLLAGEHEVVVALSRPTSGDATWVIGLGNPKSKQWLPKAFHSNN